MNMKNFENNKNFIIFWLYLYRLYSLINITIPVLLLIHLYEIKNNIKIFGKLEGKDYSVASE